MTEKSLLSVFSNILPKIHYGTFVDLSIEYHQCHHFLAASIFQWIFTLNSIQ
jgi:hypothetical protein